MAAYSAALQSIPTLGQVAVLALGGWLALHGHLSLGTFLAFSSYLLQFTAPIRMLSVLLAVAQQARAGGERVLELLESNPLVTDRPDAQPLPPIMGEIEFDDVSFGYLPSEPVLDGFSLSVRPGETVALVGASGSGKSTVALLVPRFYDVTGGTVRIDGTDVRDVALASLRRQIGMVFEDPFLFSDTIGNNIAYGVAEATPDQIEAAARAAEADEFIRALPDRYDTVVGERGLTLSGGQRQRIALARALLTDPRILLLDDATSSVDATTEAEIHATLRTLMAGRTTIVVAHRRSTLELAARIVVVDEGRVVDDGSHEELVARCPLYRRLLSGPGDDVEGIDAEGAETTDLAEVGVALAAGPNGNGVTAAAWPDDGQAGPRASVTTAAPGLGTGRFGMGLAATPELLANLDKLRAADATPDVDVAREADDEAPFSLAGFLRPYRRPLAVGLGLVIIDTLATLAGPLLIRIGIDEGVTKQSESVLWAASLAFLVVALVDWVDVYAQARYTGRTAERLLFALRVRIFAHLQRLGLDYYDREMAGRIMTRMTTDVEALSSLLQSGLITAVVNICTFLGVAVVLVAMNVTLSLATFLIVPPLLAATIWFRAGSSRAYARARDRIAAVNADLQENLSGVRVAQAYVREERNTGRFRTLAGQHLAARLDAQRMMATYFPFVLFVSDVAAAIVLGVGARLVHEQAITAGAVIAFLLYLDQFFSPIQQLSQVFDTWQQAVASMNKISELMATPTSTPEVRGAPRVGSLRGEIHLDGVRFRYPGALTSALDGVDLEVPAGQAVALVGETGAGKSTIVKLIARFYDPVAGAVLVDGTDLRTVDLDSYRQRLGYVPQEPFLFTGTIRDNIAYGRPFATDDEVEAAARAVGAHDFIARLPRGYRNPVTERGRSLSAGQRQLVCLARAQLVDPAILLLDEATANLDLTTEAHVQAAMASLASGRTTVVIAHRLQTARRADRIVVVDAGRIVEDGTHDELVAFGGRYAQMWSAFATEAEKAS
jgi:ATP-binding cassette subfamily B protein